MTLQQDSTAVAAARAHVQAWSNHDWDRARGGLAPGVRVLAATIDPMPPRVELTGVDEYMRGLIEFAQIVVPDTAQVITAWGDERRALLTLTVRVAFGPDAPHMTLIGGGAGLRGGAPVDGHFRVRTDRIDRDGKLTLGHNSRLHHIGIGRAWAGTKILMLIHNLDIRIITGDGALIRELTLNPDRDYQPSVSSSGFPLVA
jgi:hypothetical protein